MVLQRSVDVVLWYSCATEGSKTRHMLHRARNDRIRVRRINV